MNTPLSWLALGLFAVSTFCANTSLAQSAQAPVLVDLNGPVSAELESHLKSEQIQLLHSYGDGIYLATALPSFARPVLAKAVATKARSNALTQNLSKARSHSSSSKIELTLAYPGAAEYLGDVLAKADFQLAPEQVQGGVTLIGTTTAAGIERLLQSPLVVGINPAIETYELLHFEQRIAQGVTPLNSGIPGAPNLNGSGIIVGIGDGGTTAGHPDLGDRRIYETPTYNGGWGNHPDMVTGIIAGAGLMNPQHQGIAKEAEVVVDYTNRITYYAPQHAANYGMTITNNSYGPSFHCSVAGNYYGSSASLDQQLYDNESLLHVFAAGNSGRSTCTERPVGYGNLPHGEMNAKNTLAVGNVGFDRKRYHTSSAGPTRDGRLKPEIVGIGRSVTSLNRSESYGTGNGTSYAAPGVVGTLALLSEAYQQLHPGQNPDGALLKAIACNTATDLGNDGPDFIFGYGLIDGARALQTINANRYYKGALAQTQRYEQALAVPAATEVLKVMLYWPDQAGPSNNAGPVLVNDFDLYLTDALGDTIRPLTLDHNFPTAVAAEGIDTLNNIEQVRLLAPAAGNYKIHVVGTKLPLGTTDFYITWEAQQPEVVLTCPTGGEIIQPGAGTYIAWNASRGQTGNWRIEQRVVGGAWQTLHANLPAASRSYNWAVPFSTDQYEVRVTNLSSGLSDITDQPVTLVARPAALKADPVCDGSIRLAWSPVAEAVSYEILDYDGSTMSVVTETSDTSIILSNRAVGETGRYTVRTITSSGHKSRRAVAVTQISELNGAGCMSPLPVDWVQVRAEDKGAAVRIHWTIANEFNSDHYVLLRGLPFGDTLMWEEVVEVASFGDGTALRDYSADDLDPGTGATAYYRVRQVDVDGTSSLSVVVSTTRSATGIAGPRHASIVQNPVREVLHVHSYASAKQEGVLVDIAGRERAKLILAPGDNHIAWPAALTTGMYVLRTMTEHGMQTVKLVKE